MGRNTLYSLDFMLKIKKINPNFEFSGEDKKRWEEFLESQKEDSLIDTIENMEPAEKPKRKNKSKKVNQVVERKNTESMDYFVENEIDEESN